MKSATGMGPVHPAIGFRPEFLKGKILFGREIQLKIPNGEVHKGQFAIVELSEILASHNEETFSDTDGYPLDINGENINDRNYADDLNSQAKVVEFAQNLEADRVISTSRTPSGTPIITKDGIVISGNNRTMSIKLAVKRFPDKYEDYLKFLQEEITSFGFNQSVGTALILGDRIPLPGSSFDNPLALQFAHPILVRIDYDFPDYNTTELSKFNKETKKAERPIDKAIKLGKMLKGNERCEGIISEILGKYETFSEFYASFSDQKQLKDTLVNCNILTTQEVPAYFYERGFTEQGKELIENLLAGMVLSKDALVASNEGGAKALRQTIITSLPVLTANLSLDQESLMPEINEAILLQAQMMAGKMTFQDIVNQSNIFGEKPSEYAMYMNRLFFLGRNKFKAAIEGYNASVLQSKGENLFGDKPTKEEIFNAHIVSKIDLDDKMRIEKMYPEAQENEVKKLDTNLQSQKATESMINKPINPFVGGNFFTENPDKILAVTSSATSRFKKPITVYKGSLEDVYRIPVDESFLMAHEAENPALSVINESVFDATDVNTEVADNFAKALVQSKVDETKKIARKSKKNTGIVQGTVTATETMSLREVYHKINPEISIDDLQVYLWYRNSVGRPITNPEWLEIAQTTPEELYNNPSLVESWVKQGHLYYFNGQLLPAYLYLAENVYDKKNRLIAVKEESNASGMDKETIIEKYGQEVYDNQVNALNEVFRSKDQNRLLIRGEGSTQGLILLPISKLARNFMVKTLADEITFKWKKVSAQSDRFFGKMDILAVNVDRNKMTEFPELSLLEAFMYWLRTSETVPFQKGVSYADVIAVYLLAKSKPQTQAKKDEMGNYVGEQLIIKKKEDDAWERLKSKSKNEGDRLFAIFLDTQLTLNDKLRLEYQWNRTFNGYIPINYNKVPVAFRCNAFIDGAPAIIEPEKREAVAFNFSEGSGLVAYDVGVGKTPSAIFTVCQFIDAGYAKRPVLVVPNQTYKQWISEFKKFANHIKINSFYNLSKEYIEDWIDDTGKVRPVSEGSVSIMTYEGMKQMGFNEDTINRMKPDLASILLQENSAEVAAMLSSKKRDREAERLNSSVEKIIGKSLAKTTISIEDLGFDFIGFDEAHACKKVFTSVKGEAEETGPETGARDNKKDRSVVRYEISSGEPSFNGIKGFMLCQYIQTTYGGNTLLLTATPFTNSPLEIYSMLAMVAYHKLREMQLDNLGTFFENYIAVSYEMIINSRLRPERKQVILGFNNIISLQTLIRRFINYKSGDQVPSVVKKRPSKIVLPMKTKMIGGVLTMLNDDEKVDTILPLTPLQNQYMEQVKAYANGDITEKAMCTGTLEEEDEEISETSQGVEVDETYLDEKEKRGVTTLKAMAHARNLALSPYIFECAGLGVPTYEQYIETSNKLSYVMECIRTIKDHHIKNSEPMSGIIIYMDRGKKYFSLVKEYLVKKLGFKPHEIGIMSSGLMEPIEKKMSKEDQKEYIKNLFLGLRYNEVTMEMEEISADERVKVIIGSSMIREGINLQAHTSTLFNCWLDWNPSDLQQLYGRLYRQGNKFKTVRLVVPLMIDSMDIFMFQKLEEKTSRINTIWESDGQTNVFNTAEFNPHDLKYALIKNANVLAELELQEKGEKLDEDIADLENKIKRNKKILQYQATINSHTEDLQEWLEEYRPSDGRIRSVETMISLAQEVLRGQKDSLGKPMVYSYLQEPKKVENNFYSELAPASKRYWFDDFIYSVRNMKREVRDYLEPNKITIKDLDKFSTHLEKQIEETRERQKTIAGPEAIAERANEINLEREKSAVKEREVMEVVNEFTRLNYLLSEVKLPEIKVKVTEMQQCPPLDANGIPRIDPAGIDLLNACIKKEPSTKRLHTIEVPDGENIMRVYTPEREKLHKEIISKLTKSSVCTDQNQPIAVLTGGAPGSGKSTFLKKFAPFLQSPNIFKIDADEIREFLPEYKGWNSAVTHEEARDIVNELLDSFDKPCKHDLLYDGTMSNSQKYFPLIEKLKRLGYKVYVAYMDIPKEVSIERAMKRYQNNKGGKNQFGRFVSLDIIEDFFKTNKAGYEEIKTMVDGYILVNNLTGEIIERGGESLPQDREYNVMFEDSKQELPAAKAEPTKADFLASLKGAKVAVKYASGDEKKDLQAYIKGLEITIKYL